jgi:hypothetical protein
VSSSFYHLSMPSCGDHGCPGWWFEEHHSSEKRGKSLVLTGTHSNITVWFLWCWRMVRYHISNHWWSQSWENCCQPHRRIKLMITTHLKCCSNLEKWQNHLLPSCWSGCIEQTTSAGTECRRKVKTNHRGNSGTLFWDVKHECK